ncbi:AfsR/SARP family transcriptional regulator [Spirillospora sp. NBC_01491]|uniref:AfsR/SARP family transcriptional regulator n=1 Tax=Spirillospora sp. NBC_01491 TaxID=2976007 RepID=UPI002E315676|nr:BTAD domain-containing putative transcriptional regulator [Spirillospora sp. NBC_01491]
MLVYRILGPVEVSDDGVPVAVDGALRRAVLGALLLEAGQVVSDQALVSALWAVPPATALVQLRQHVSALRRVLGAPTILRRGSGYAIHVEPGGFDLEVFMGLAARGRAAMAGGRPEEAEALLREALGLWGGAPLDGAAHDFVRQARPALEERRLAVLEDWLDVGLALSRHPELVGEILGQLTRNPLRERLRGQLMLALYRCGRQSEALRVFRDGRALLGEELGLEPGAGLRRLERAIHACDPSLDPAPGVGTRREPPRRPPLPADLPDFTGREEQLAEVSRLLETASGRSAPTICVISGGPGTGKSALALHLAHLWEAVFPDGRFHVDLRRDGGDPMPALARLLSLLGVDGADVPASAAERAELYRYRMAGLRALVVLDGATGEHQVRPLLTGAPGCPVLITCRGRLPGIGFADRVDLGAFAPEDSVELLTRVGGAARVSAEPAAAALVAELCGHLPLALRIAGGRLAATPHSSVGRLAARLGDEDRRLDELRAGDLELRPVLARACAGLAPPARRALRLLGRRGAGRFCATEAAAALAESLDEAEDLIGALMNAGLVEYSGTDDGGHDTYRLPTLLGLYARDLPDVPDGPDVPGGPGLPDGPDRPAAPADPEGMAETAVCADPGGPRR